MNKQNSQTIVIPNDCLPSLIQGVCFCFKIYYVPGFNIWFYSDLYSTYGFNYDDHYQTYVNNKYMVKLYSGKPTFRPFRP